jgi:hypothetical protein
MKYQIHHIDGNLHNNNSENLRRVRVAANKSAPVKRPRGRPELAPEDRLEVGTVRLSREQWAKFAQLGGAEWLRKAINRAKLPK